MNPDNVIRGTEDRSNTLGTYVCPVDSRGVVHVRFFREDEREAADGMLTACQREQLRTYVSVNRGKPVRL